jgi:hypothetical protein
MTKTTGRAISTGKSMTSLLAALLLAVVGLTPAHADPRPIVQPKIVAPAEPNEADLQAHDHYQNSDGHAVHSPSKSKTGLAPAGATAQCRDGTWSFSQHRRGTCSRHGGVAAWQ